MKRAKLLLSGTVGVLAMGLSLAISQVVLADIAQDNADINNVAGELPDDTFAMKADRQVLKDAIDSGDKEKIREARKALRKDIKDREKVRKDIRKEEQEKRQDRRRTHRGNSNRGKDGFGINQDTFGSHQDGFGINQDTFGAHQDKLGIHKDTFGVHQDKLDLHQDTFDRD